MSFRPWWLLDQARSERRRVSTTKTLLSALDRIWLAPRSRRRVYRRESVGPDGVGRRINRRQLFGDQFFVDHLELVETEDLVEHDQLQDPEDREARQIRERDQSGIEEVAPVMIAHDVARREGTNLTEGDAGEGQ